MTEAERAEIFARNSMMESPVQTAADIFAAIAIMAETFDDKEGVPLQRLAWIGKAALKEVENLRGEIFRLSHKNPEIRQRAAK